MPRLSRVLAWASVSRLSEMVPRSKQEIALERELKCSPDLFLQVSPRRECRTSPLFLPATNIFSCPNKDTNHLIHSQQHATSINHETTQNNRNHTKTNRRVLASLTWKGANTAP
ncbi:hypothetical protein DEO72_LG9g1334 [Vigna unguiculata]|uniref:Uncharacterized protein n=1 Tax=Vigna unguiculata TaxID=3917 RepID=A0A4D6MY03_VIGUN|nr:hypothetical protein DEO72_LG9g1334 [Vigna unguiculata]